MHQMGPFCFVVFNSTLGISIQLWEISIQLWEISIRVTHDPKPQLVDSRKSLGGGVIFLRRGSETSPKYPDPKKTGVIFEDPKNTPWRTAGSFTRNHLFRVPIADP